VAEPAPTRVEGDGGGAGDLIAGTPRTRPVGWSCRAGRIRETARGGGAGGRAREARPGAGPAGGARSAARALVPRRLVSLNFDNADIEIVVQAAAEITGINYVLGPNVRGRKVTVQTIGKIPSDEIFPLLLTILDANGLAAVKSGDLYRIISREGAQQSPLRTVVGREPAPAGRATRSSPRSCRCASWSPRTRWLLLRPFVPQQGAVTAHEGTNLLILTDTAANVRRLLDIVKLVDVAGAVDEMVIIPVKHSDAQELAQLLNQLFASGRLRSSLPPGPLALPVPAPPPPPGAHPAAPRSPIGPSETGGPGERPPLIVAERRSNSIVIHARKGRWTPSGASSTSSTWTSTAASACSSTSPRTPRRATSLPPSTRSTVGTTVAPPSPEPRRRAWPRRPAPIWPAAGRPPRSRRRPPRRPPSWRSRGPPGAGVPGAPGEGARALGEVRFVADEVTNAVIVTTYPRIWKEIEETIKQLDRMPRQVLIEVLAAEVSLTDDTKLGIEWAVRSGKFSATSSPSGTLPSKLPLSLIPLGGPVPMGLTAFAFATDKFLSALNALAIEDRVNVLSSPSIMTTENKKAVINVSTSVPIVTSQQVPVATGGITGNSITQAVEYRDAGVILTVTPRIGEQGTVALEVRQEVNEVGAPEPPPINSPRFTKRKRRRRWCCSTTRPSSSAGSSRPGAHSIAPVSRS
jgi:general secretion pathway protein D